MLLKGHDPKDALGRHLSVIEAGAIALANRVVMAQMTRDRGGPHDEPTPLMVEYYRQRAGAPG